MTLQIVASLTIVIDDTSQGNNTFIIQASLMIITYDHHNMFIVEATALTGSIVVMNSL